MDMRTFVVIAIAAAFLLAFGCTGPVNNTGGMESPRVCRDYCEPGQIQAPYPDCSCSGGTVGPMPTAGPGGYNWTPVPGGNGSSGGGGGGGGTGGGTGGTGGTGGNGTGGSGGTGASGTNGSQAGTGGAGWGVTGDDVLRYGSAALASDQEGMIIVLIGSRNANESPYSAVSLGVGAVSTYRPGAGGGWSTLSTGTKTIELKGLGGKHALLSQGRAGVGVHTRLLVELTNLSVSYNGSARAVTLPKGYYVIIDGVPLTRSGTSAVKLTFDLNRSVSMSRDGNAMIFTPVVEIESLDNVRHIIGDDGIVSLSAGTLELKELAIFDESGTAVYTVEGGVVASCMENCTDACLNRTSALCFARCSPQCLGVADTIASACDDGTPYNTCSRRKPAYCVTGTYLMRCGTCGCPESYDCLADGTCRYTPFAEGGAACSGEYCVDGNPPIACRGGQFTQDCVACGCPEGKDCRTSDGVCVPQPSPTP